MARLNGYRNFALRIKQLNGKAVPSTGWSTYFDDLAPYDPDLRDAEGNIYEEDLALRTGVVHENSLSLTSSQIVSLTAGHAMLGYILRKIQAGENVPEYKPALRYIAQTFTTGVLWSCCKSGYSREELFEDATDNIHACYEFPGSMNIERLKVWHKIINNDILSVIRNIEGDDIATMYFYVLIEKTREFVKSSLVTNSSLPNTRSLELVWDYLKKGYVDKVTRGESDKSLSKVTFDVNFAEIGKAFEEVKQRTQAGF